MTSKTLYNWMMDGTITEGNYATAIDSGKISTTDARTKLLTSAMVVYLIAETEADPGVDVTAPVTGEIVNETPDGTEDTFTVDYPFETVSEIVYVNGQAKARGATHDYVPTPATGTIVFNAGCIPETGDVVMVSYRKA